MIAGVVWSDDGAEVDAVDDRAIVTAGDPADTSIAGAFENDGSEVDAVDNRAFVFICNTTTN